MSKAGVLLGKGRGRGSPWVLPAPAGKIKRDAQGLGKKGASLPRGFKIRLRLTGGHTIRTVAPRGKDKSRTDAKGWGMQDITKLEQRITAALERIGKGVDRIAAKGGQPAREPASPAAADAALRAQLDDEKALTAQLQERLRALKERDSQGGLQEKVDRLTQQLDVQGLELQRMRRTAASLRDQLAQLRQAQAAGVVEPQLINKAMLAELEALRATRLTEMAEMDEILAALEPHLAEAGHA